MFRVKVRDRNVLTGIEVYIGFGYRITVWVRIMSTANIQRCQPIKT